MTMNGSTGANRRGLRQDIVVQALRLMQGDEARYAVEAGLSQDEFTSATRDLLREAEGEVLGFVPAQPQPAEGQPASTYPPRYVSPSVFKELMGIGRLSEADIVNLVRARLDQSSAATDGK